MLSLSRIWLGEGERRRLSAFDPRVHRLSSPRRLRGQEISREIWGRLFREGLAVCSLCRSLSPLRFLSVCGFFSGRIFVIYFCIHLPNEEDYRGNRRHSTGADRPVSSPWRGYFSYAGPGIGSHFALNFSGIPFPIDLEFRPSTRGSRNPKDALLKAASPRR